MQRSTIENLPVLIQELDREVRLASTAPLKRGRIVKRRPPGHLALAVDAQAQEERRDFPLRVELRPSGTRSTQRATEERLVGVRTDPWSARDDGIHQVFGR